MQISKCLSNIGSTSRRSMIEEHVPDLQAGTSAHGAAGQRSDRQHRIRLGHPLAWDSLHLLRSDNGSDHSVHACDRSPIRSLRHTRENSILPGMMNTPMVHAPEVIAAYGGSAEEMVRRRDEQCPMGRMGDAWDVAYAALFLASDEAKYITGTELVV